MPSAFPAAGSAYFFQWQEDLPLKRCMTGRCPLLKFAAFHQITPKELSFEICSGVRRLLPRFPR